jgi:hypothetical protein
MNRRVDDLWATAASDGASTPVGIVAVTHTEIEELVDAWSRERTGRIESSLVLEEAGRLLARLLAEVPLEPIRRRQTKRVLRAIRQLENDKPGEFGP